MFCYFKIITKQTKIVKVSVRFFKIFLTQVSYAYQAWIYFIKKNTVKTVICKTLHYSNKCFIFSYILNVIYSCDAKLYIQHH